MARRQRYRHQIVIQTPTDSQNAYGELTASWATLLTVWAAMESTAAGETLEAGNQVQQNRFLFEVYYNSGITSKCRIKYGSRYFDIEGVYDIDNRGRKMRITAVETDENT